MGNQSGCHSSMEPGWLITQENNAEDRNITQENIWDCFQGFLLIFSLQETSAMRQDGQAPIMSYNVKFIRAITYLEMHFFSSTDMALASGSTLFLLSVLRLGTAAAAGNCIPFTFFNVFKQEYLPFWLMSIEFPGLFIVKWLMKRPKRDRCNACHSILAWIEFITINIEQSW